MTADLPVLDDRTVPDVTFTLIHDVGRFVARACTLPQGSWPEEFYMAGQTLNMMEVVAIVEKARGSKMTVRKHTKSSMQAQIDAISPDSEKEEDLMGRFFLQLTLAFADGAFKSTVMPPELNERFPDVKCTSIEEYVSSSWLPIASRQGS